MASTQKLTDKDLVELASRGRNRFTDEEVEAALLWMKNNPTATLQQAAHEHGMTPQTLNTRKKQLLKARGIKLEKPAAGTKKKAAK